MYSKTTGLLFYVAAALLADGAMAQGPTTTTPIKHVVVMFQENVSFDHYFATYPYAANSTPGEPVFSWSPNTPSINGLTPALLTHNPNSAQPFRLPRSQSAICDQDHDYGDEQRAYIAALRTSSSRPSVVPQRPAIPMAREMESSCRTTMATPSPAFGIMRRTLP